MVVKQIRAMSKGIRNKNRGQTAEIPQVLLNQDRDAFLNSVPIEFQVEAEEVWNDNVKSTEQQRLEFIENSVITIAKQLQNAELGRFYKPLLTIDEAAAMLSLSTKRFNNIICEERARLGCTPDYICDARGMISRRVLRDKLLEWASQRKKKVCRRRAI